MADDDDVQSIFELESRITGLLSWAREVGKSELDSLRALDRAKLAPYSTLQSAMKSGRISVRDQRALADAYGFRLDWAEWRDRRATRLTPSDQRVDSAKSFLEKFVAHKSSGTCLAIEADLTDGHIDRRFADFSFAVSGSFEPSRGGEGIPLVLSLSFDGRPWPVSLDCTIGLMGVDLQLIHEHKGASIDIFPITCDSDAEGNFDARVGSPIHPYWIIKVAHGDDACVSGWRRRNDGQDCVCRRFSAGTTIEARMTARVRDDFDVRLEGKQWEGISDTKARLAEHLITRGFLKPDDWEVTLGVQILKVIEQS
jgi:hypothetical protein